MILGVAPSVSDRVSEAQLLACVDKQHSTLDVRGTYTRGEQVSEFSLRNHLQLAKDGWVLQSLEDGAVERIDAYLTRSYPVVRTIVSGPGGRVAVAAVRGDADAR